MSPLASADIDLDLLRKLYEESGPARALLDHLAGRERNWRETSVDRLLTNVGHISRRDLIDILKRLEQLGVGEFLVGRRGHPSRFQWKVGMVSVGLAAAGEGEELDPEVGEDNEEEEEAADLLMALSFPLRRDLAIELRLPRDLTEKEAARLARFIESIPSDAPAE